MEIYIGEAKQPVLGLCSELSIVDDVSDMGPRVDRRIAKLQASLDPDLGLVLHYVRVDFRHRREGLATLLIREFADRIGPGQPLMGFVVHNETRDMLRSRYQEALVQDVEIRERDQLDALPIVSLLEKGGIHVERICIQKYDTGYNPTPEKLQTLPLAEAVRHFGALFYGFTAA